MLQEVAQKIAALKVELRKKDAAIARLVRKLQRARAGVVDDDSEGECEDESYCDEEGDANYGEEIADRMDVALERKQLHEDEEDQTEKDSEEEKHGEEDEKQADGKEKHGLEEKK
ncbi:histone chaperone ASF1-like [Andrographis paniculata]|uniref:histone chaperone ASF1-like n=1 Tax=Andrographis paniculata TaxID=175694 RepID=UPI0021E72ED1|nr:histone chaperone ASF1-like [Andrographis paniculata]